MDTFEAPVEVKGYDDDENIVEAYVAVFGNKDHDGDVIQKGAFSKTIDEKVPTGKIKFVDGHNYSIKSTLGTVVDADEDTKGLLTRIKLATTEDAQQAKQKMLEGHVNKFSFGFITHEDGLEMKDGEKVRLLKEVELLEVTGSPVPINDQTELVSVKSAINKAISDEEKTFPGFPFDTFDGCVNHFEDDPEVDDPDKFCGFLEKRVNKGFSDMDIEIKQLSEDEVGDIIRIAEIVLDEHLDDVPQSLLDDLKQRLMNASEGSEEGSTDGGEGETSQPETSKARSDQLSDYLCAEIDEKAVEAGDEAVIVSEAAHETGMSEKGVRKLIYGNAVIPGIEELKAIASVLGVPRHEVVEVAKADGFETDEEISTKSIDERLEETEKELLS